MDKNVPRTFVQCIMETPTVFREEMECLALSGVSDRPGH